MAFLPFNSEVTPMSSTQLTPAKGTRTVWAGESDVPERSLPRLRALIARYGQGEMVVLDVDTEDPADPLVDLGRGNPPQPLRGAKGISCVFLRSLSPSRKGGEVLSGGDGC